MDISIKAIIDLKAIDKMIAKEMQKSEIVMIRNLQYAGLEGVNTARRAESYKDRTSNLRSSTGFVVVANGRVVNFGSFKPIKEGEEGSKSGRVYAEELAEEHKLGYVVSIVAGMPYASSVAARGYDVLDSAELNATAVAERLFKK